jgi:hypothetical protein
MEQELTLNVQHAPFFQAHPLQAALSQIAYATMDL